MKNNNIKSSKGIWTMLFALTALIWGVAFVVVKDSIQSVTPLYMLAMRFFIAAAACVPLCIQFKCSIDKNTVIKGIILGVALFTAYALQTYGINYTTAGKNAFITAFYMVLVPFFNLLFFGKRVNRMQIFAAFMALAGVGLLTLGGDTGINIGDALTFLCAIVFALQIILTGRFCRDVDAFMLNTVQLVTVTVLSLIAAPIFEGPPAGAVVLSGRLIASMLYLGLLSTMFAECVQTIGLKYVSPLLATILMSLESVFGVLASVVLLGERLTGKMVTGCVLMFAAIIIIELKEAE